MLIGWLVLAWPGDPVHADTAPTPSGAQAIDPEDLAALVERGARIGHVEIEALNVFDIDDPEESKRVYRWANRVHVKTRDSVIESGLLFKPGDPFNPRLLAESARLLRSRDFLVDALVEPTAFHEATNTVDVRAVTRDGWSLSPELKLGRNGGENEFGIGIEESNILGTGKGLTVSYSSDVDRDETFIGYSDPNVRGSWAQLDVVLAHTSDGHRASIAAGRPFYALDTHWSVGGEILSDERIDAIYDLGEDIDEFSHSTRRFVLEGGWSQGLRDRRALRWLAGITYDEHRFEPSEDVATPLLLPDDRKLVYPWLGLELVEDDYRVMTELNDMGRTEDVPLGLRVTARLGFATDTFGADRRATLLDVELHDGWELGAGQLLLLDASASTRREQRDQRNSIVSFDARFYRRTLGRHLFLANLHGTASHRLDPERQILLGGDNGLRGYPLRYQSGKHLAALTLEQRFFTDWYPLRLFRVGYAVFFDIGRVWGTDPRGTAPIGTLSNIGAGLRLTSPRSSSRQVVHVDLATPLRDGPELDSWQLTVETKRSF